MTRQHLITLSATMTLTACAGSMSTAILLPGEDGRSVGELALLRNDGLEVAILNRPNERAKSSGNRSSISDLAAKQIERQYGGLLDSLPPGPRSYTLYFSTGTTTLTPESALTIEHIRADVPQRPGVELQVTGYTDTIGSAEDNDRLSAQRAQDVANMLIARGFPPDMITVIGRGERDPSVATGDNVSNPANRRIEVLVR